MNDLCVCVTFFISFNKPSFYANISHNTICYCSQLAAILGLFIDPATDVQQRAATSLEQLINTIDKELLVTHISFTQQVVSRLAIDQAGRRKFKEIPGFCHAKVVCVIKQIENEKQNSFGGDSHLLGVNIGYFASI